MVVWHLQGKLAVQDTKDHGTFHMEIELYGNAARFCRLGMRFCAWFGWQQWQMTGKTSALSHRFWRLLRTAKVNMLRFVFARVCQLAMAVVCVLFAFCFVVIWMFWIRSFIVLAGPLWRIRFCDFNWRLHGLIYSNFLLFDATFLRVFLLQIQNDDFMFIIRIFASKIWAMSNIFLW